MRGILLRALESQVPIIMIYLSEDEVFTQRWIRVVEINQDRIKAYCYLRKEYRVFSLSNILSVSPIRKKEKGA